MLTFMRLVVSTNNLIRFSRNVITFTLATFASVLSGCTTVEGIRPTTPNASYTQAQVEYKAQKISSVLHPAVQIALDDIGQQRGQSFNASEKCSDNLLAGNGPTFNGATNSTPVKQVENAIGGVINQGLSKAGRFGQIAKPTVDGIRSSSSAQADQLQLVCGRIGQVNARFISAENLPDSQRNYIYQQDYDALRRAMTLAYNARLTDGAVGANGVDAINQRGLNQSQTNLWRDVLNGIYKPKSNGGVFGDGLNKVFK